MLRFMPMTTQHGGKEPARDPARDKSSTEGSPGSSDLDQAEQYAASFRPAWEAESSDAYAPTQPLSEVVAPSSVDPRAGTASQQLATAVAHPRGSVLKKTLIGTAPPANLPPELAPSASPVVAAAPKASEEVPPKSQPPVAAVAVISSDLLAPKSASPQGPTPKSAGRHDESKPAPKSESKTGVTSAAALANAPKGKASDEPKVIVAAEITQEAVRSANQANASIDPRQQETVVLPRRPVEPPNANATLEIDDAQILEMAAAFPKEPGFVGHASASPGMAPVPSTERAAHAAFVERPKPVPALETTELQALVPKRSNTPVLVGVGVLVIGLIGFFVVKSNASSDETSNPQATAAATTVARAPERNNDIPPPTATTEGASTAASPTTETSPVTKPVGGPVAEAKTAEAASHEKPATAEKPVSSAGATSAATAKTTGTHTTTRPTTTAPRATTKAPATHPATTPKNPTKAPSTGIVREDPF